MDAPLITLDDAANTTDVYAFVSERGGKKFLSTHVDGSYTQWSCDEVSKEPVPLVTPHIPFGPFPCKAIERAHWLTIPVNRVHSSS